MRILKPILYIPFIALLFSSCSPLSKRASYQAIEVLPGGISVSGESVAADFKIPRGSKWRYQLTGGESILGRSSDELSISTDEVSVRFEIPQGFHVRSCVDEPLDWHFRVTSKKQNLGFYVSLDKTSKSLTLAEMHQVYLSSIHSTHDDSVKFVPATLLYLKDGSRITPYLYSSKYWGERLVVKIPNGKYVTTFEFYTPESLNNKMKTIKKVIGSHMDDIKK